MPPLQVLDAVQNGTVECGQTASCYYVGKNPAPPSIPRSRFKKLYEAWSAFRDDQHLWFRVAENTFDNFVYSIKSPAPAGKK